MKFVKPFIAVLFLLGSAGMSYAAAATYLGHDDGSFVVADASNPQLVVHDSASGTVVRSTDGECVRTYWETSKDECGTPNAPVRTAMVISREERTIYFGFNQGAISPEMKQKLDGLAGKLTADSTVKGARIVGYADRIGNAAYNEKLSKKRAENVRQYLIKRGLINTQVADTRWLGASSPVTDCAANLKRTDLIACLQPDRRVEVEIDYASDVQASR